MALVIDILEFLVENPHHRGKIKELIELQREIWNLTKEKAELKHDIKTAKYLYEHYDSMLEILRNC
jgi:hypothetical protein